MVTRDDVLKLLKRANSIENKMDSMVKSVLKQLGAVDREHAVHFDEVCPLLNSSEIESGDELVGITDVWFDKKSGVRANYREYCGRRIYENMCLAKEIHYRAMNLLSYLSDKI